jgi:hypothetical protein
MSDFECYVDKEDLTDKVREKVRGLGGNTVIAVRGVGSNQPKRWKVIVECSKGHRNSFSDKDQK